MLFEIDVSGEDILSGNYAIAIANKDKVIYGFRFANSLIFSLNKGYNGGRYRYKGKGGKKKFKIRVYCIVVYHIFKQILKRERHISKEDIVFNICRDFDGHENDIKSNLEFFLKGKLGLSILDFNYCRLPDDSNANKYAYIFRKDTKNVYPNLINISLKDFENLLKKK